MHHHHTPKVSGALAATTYQSLVAGIVVEREAAKASLNAARTALAEAEYEESHQTVMRANLDAISRWSSLATPERKQILREAFESMEFFRRAKTGDPVKIKLKFRSEYDPEYRNTLPPS